MKLFAEETSDSKLDESRSKMQNDRVRSLNNLEVESGLVGFGKPTKVIFKFRAWNMFDVYNLSLSYFFNSDGIDSIRDSLNKIYEDETKIDQNQDLMQCLLIQNKFIPLKSDYSTVQIISRQMAAFDKHKDNAKTCNIMINDSLLLDVKDLATLQHKRLISGTIINAYMKLLNGRSINRKNKNIKNFCTNTYFFYYLKQQKFDRISKYLRKQVCIYCRC